MGNKLAPYTVQFSYPDSCPDSFLCLCSILLNAWSEHSIKTTAGKAIAKNGAKPGMK